MPGVYVSYPFCAQKCTYCNFASGVFPRELEARYLDALMGEISAHAWQWTPDTVYLGGGTPSSMDPAALAQVLTSIPGRPWAEATVEASPGTITANNARAWVEAGIDRVSLGVQSFVEREIRRTGRKHTAATVAADIAVLREAGVTAVNLDLIAGLASQTEASWRQSLDWVERLAPEHVSIYMLEVDEDSRLGKEMMLGGVRYGAGDAPSEDATAAFYEIAVERLAGMGIPRYEISNFARPGRKSRHNLKYWTLASYVGFGADAHSFDGRARWANAESPAEYVEGPGRTEAPAGSDERLFLGLRLSAGVQPTAEEWRVYAEPIRRFLSDGLLEARDGALRLTDRGVLLSNEVFQEFLRGMIDLRSDTVTKPTPEMRRAMMDAPVGDDVYGEDPTVNLLERRAAEIAGKEAALFVPTGTMGNTIAIKLLTEHGQEVIADSRAHVLDYELSMVAWFSGCVIRPIQTDDGILSWEQVRRQIRPVSPYSAPTGCVTLENTHNMHGGTVYPQATAREICDGVHERGLRVHMDGARIFNAAAALHVPVREIAAPADTVMFCLSKALGAPAGSILAGPAALIAKGRLYRKRLGGGMRQVGVLAAAGLVALDETPPKLADDHCNAKFLAEGLSRIPGIAIDPARVQTNITVFDVSGTGQAPADISAALRRREVLVNFINDRQMRAVTHYDVSRDDCAAALEAIAATVAS